MNSIISEIFFICSFLAFITTFLLHLQKNNSSLIITYLLQSVFVSIIVATFALKEGSTGLLLVALLTFIIKAIVAPRFFFRLVNKHQMTFSGTTYLNTPMTLLIITFLTAAAYSSMFSPLRNLFQASLTTQQFSFLTASLAILLISLFFIMNRKGALSQSIGVLSLENGIVTFSSLVGLEHTFSLEIGIIFDLFVWIIIAVVFVSMIYRKFGTLDVSTLTHLRE